MKKNTLGVLKLLPRMQEQTSFCLHKPTNAISALMFRDEPKWSSNTPASEAHLLMLHTAAPSSGLDHSLWPRK